MINVNFEDLLNTMTRTQIMNLFESQLDTAIARRIEREAADAAYKKAKEAVANDSYTSDDLVILQKRLNDVKRLINSRDTRGEANVKIDNANINLNAKSQPKTVATVCAPEELRDILDALRFPFNPGNCTFDE